jgi:asparagine synthase (glutamine-hydrolysing)
MASRLAHRGPDGEGFWRDGPVAFGHRRLAVIDLSDLGRQPMSDVDGRCSIVFNGEIYNFRQLREELERSGARFVSRTDTEVILEAYKRWGVDCLTRLNGMFAFALWDAAEQRLLLARDRAGEKPLFYQPLADGLIFASELQALRAHPLAASGIDGAALSQFLSFNYVVDPRCLVDGVRKLEPAHYIVAGRQGLQPPRCYWSLMPSFGNKARFNSVEEAAESLDSLITDAVRIRLVSDVPLGAFLSGGIDSSAVVGTMARLGTRDQTRTFSIGFAEATYDEVPHARAAARVIGVDHRDQTVNADMASALPEIVRAGDEPMADSSSVPVYYLARFARQSVTVCLSGDGGDENFAGYETYRADAINRATSAVPRWIVRGLSRLADASIPVTFDKVSLDFKVRQFLRAHGRSADRAHASWREIFSEADKQLVLRPETWKAIRAVSPFEPFERHAAEARALDPLDRSLYVDVRTWLASDILVKVDRMTMAHALESRAPFLDHRLMEFAAALPPDLKLRGLRSKYLLKVNQRKHLPDSIVGRRKAGFNAPVSAWLAGPLHDLGRAATAATTLGEWFDPKAIDRLWDEHRRKIHDHGLKLFGLTWLGLWLTHCR